MNIKFLSLGSGSSGNCYYLGTDTYSILIDAGVGIRTIKKIFKEYSLSLSTVRAVFITHDHADHIKAAGHLAAKHNIPIYSTPEVHQGMRRSYCMTEKIDNAHAKFINKGETITVEDFEITCFEVPHDGTDKDVFFPYRHRPYHRNGGSPHRTVELLGTGSQLRQNHASDRSLPAIPERKNSGPQRPPL